MIQNDFSKNPEAFLIKKIKEFVRKSPENLFHKIDKEPIFKEPLVGYADGKDPLFKSYKSIIGSFHLTPYEVISKLAPKAFADNLSVICWVLPASEKTKESNRAEKIYPSKRWAHTRFYGEDLNISLRKYVISILNEHGYTGIAPFITELFEVKNDTSVGIASTWSERHIMYAAGLGTFSLSDGFITEKGKAMRCGSVVTNLKLTPTRRKYKSHTENCLFFSKGVCGECIKRCPAGAISENGHDKKKCKVYNYEVILKPLQEKYGVKEVGCGLCQTGVPCESKIPL